jgi:cytoskeleton protein RodZ
MQAIGDTLREARMRRKIDISEVETATKIRAKYLRALENEEFDLLPGPTFVRSFLRTYAEYLGLDAHLLVEAYRSQYEPRPEETELQPFSQGARRRRERAYGGGGGGPGPPRGGAILAALVVGLLAFFLILGLTGDDEGSDNGSQGGETTSERSSAEARRERARRRRARERQQAAERPTRVSLRVIPAVPTYVCVDDGAGKELFEGTISSPQTWRGRRLRINLGKQSAALRVNGRRVALEGGPNPVGFDFTPGSRKELPVGERPCA